MMTLQHFAPFLLWALVPVAVNGVAVFTTDCSKYPTVCQNDCYAAFTAGKPTTLHWPGPKNAQQRRTTHRQEAGCTPNPCGGDVKQPATNQNSCDEYPFATTREGGTGAIIRCTVAKQNTNQGGDLGRFLNNKKTGCSGKACTFTTGFSNVGSASFCGSSKMGKNDGFEYTLTNGKYDLASRDENVVEARYEIHQPDPVDFFPPHLRREFLLENGMKTMVASRDLNSSYADAQFFYVEGDEVFETRMVRELFGNEKSPELRHTDEEK